MKIYLCDRQDVAMIECGGEIGETFMMGNSWQLSRVGGFKLLALTELTDRIWVGNQTIIPDEHTLLVLDLGDRVISDMEPDSPEEIDFRLMFTEVSWDEMVKRFGVENIPDHLLDAVNASEI